MLASVDGAESFSLARLIGTWFREASVLILVFGFLDPLVDPRAGTSVTDRLSAFPGTWGLLVLFVSATFFAIGAILEARRRP